VKKYNPVRLLPFALIPPLCWLLVSCSRHQLPPIKDAELLRKDCALLFEQFPVSKLSTNVPDYEYQHSIGFRKIPQDKWSSSIAALHPYLVCSYQGGIQMWIAELPIKEQGKLWQGYFIVVKPEEPPPPQAATNQFVFQQTEKAGILLLKQTRF